MEILMEKFGTINGKPVRSFTLKNENGMAVTCLDYGCIITSIVVPDANGRFENVVLGFDSLEEYIEHSPFFGAICGRVAGLISKGEFKVEGITYQLEKNDGPNHLHGGKIGFDKVVWNSNVLENENAVEFSRTSPDGEEGYPGNLKMKVKYTLTSDNELIITYHGTSDQTTVVNVTNHTYFNLSGNLKSDILDHELQLKSNQYIEMNPELLPTGDLVDVEDTYFDFRNGRKIRSGVESNEKQTILAGQGYDHPFVLSSNNQQEIILKDHTSGRALIIESNEPCVVLYTGNQMTNAFSIRGVQSKKYLGVCLETQKAPDAINQTHLPSSIVLEKGKEYQTNTKYSFTLF